jgi:magnesium-transporting ATPase (P-type)
MVVVIVISVIQEIEKKLKYNNERKEIQWIWNMNCLIILLIAGTAGIVTKGLKYYLETIQWSHLMDSVKEMAEHYI